MKEQRTKQILICLAASLGCFWLGNRVGLLYVSAVGTVTQRLAAAVNLSKIVLHPLQLSPAPIPVGCGVGAILLAGLAYFCIKYSGHRLVPQKEYGSARWGTAADIAPFLHEKENENVPLTATESLSLAMKMPVTAENNYTKEGRNVAQKYADILHLSRPEPPVKYPRMALSNRAKIFSPFAALRGFDDEISSEGASKLLVKKVELSDEEKDALSDKLLQVKKGMKVVVRYFMKAAESTGKYISLTGTVVMIDPVYRELKVMQDSDRKAVGIEKELPVIIPFDDIADLAGEGITNIENYLGIEKYPDDI